MSDDDGINLVYRIGVAGGLRNLATFLERRLELPVPRHVNIHYPVVAESDEAERREVERIAEILGETPGYPYDPHHYTVRRNFGPVAYIATAINREHMARYLAEMEAARRAREESGD